MRPAHHHIGASLAAAITTFVGSAFGQATSATPPPHLRLEHAVTDDAADASAAPAALSALAEAYADAAQTGSRVEGQPDPAGDDLRACAALAYRARVVVYPGAAGGGAARYDLAHSLRGLGLDDDAARADLSRVCPSRYTYAPVAALEGFAAATACPNLVAWVSARHPEVLGPLASPAGDEALRRCPVRRNHQGLVQVVETCFDGCVPVSEIAADAARIPETWSALGDYFSDPPRDETAGLAIDAYVHARSGFAALTTPGAAPHPWLARASYRIASAHHRFLSDGERTSMPLFAAIADGDAPGRPGERLDVAAIETIAMTLRRESWLSHGPRDGNELESAERCDAVVVAVAAPPSTYPWPFRCSGILRLTAPRDPLAMLRASDPREVPPASGPEGLVPLDRPWGAEVYYRLARRYDAVSLNWTAITAYRLAVHVFPLHPWSVEACWRVVELYLREHDAGAVRAAVELAAYPRRAAVTQRSRGRDRARLRVVRAGGAPDRAAGVRRRSRAVRGAPRARAPDAALASHRAQARLRAHAAGTLARHRTPRGPRSDGRLPSVAPRRPRRGCDGGAARGPRADTALSRRQRRRVKRKRATMPTLPS
ncbi:MAG: hypothetical protein WCJ30_07735 [Deltaproteobacteria bacterium]